jgi:hypothetical protein
MGLSSWSSLCGIHEAESVGRRAPMLSQVEEADQPRFELVAEFGMVLTSFGEER